ncbi:MAG: NADH:flavin oxidoreductase [Firmicutes bacterium]|nr:NADH:flavin oxidoreductase [Bacillota bacterium]
MPDLFTPITVRDITIKNRIVMPPMANDLATEKGGITEALISHYMARAKAKVGLIIVEHSYIEKRGQYSEKQTGIYSDELIPGLCSLAEAIRNCGAISAIQLAHAGLKSKKNATGFLPASPSEIAIPGETEKPLPLTEDEIKELVVKYRQASRRAKEAGFDIIEIHGAHGFLINDFLSPYTNRRTDSYGGNFEKRLQFPLEVVRTVREEIGSAMPLSFRLPSDDIIAGGITIEDSKRIAVELEAAGVDIMDVSGGLSGSRPPGKTEEGYFFSHAHEIKKVIKIPVIGVGGVKNPEFADNAVREGIVDMVAVGRALLADPLWAEKAWDELKRITKQA